MELSYDPTVDAAYVMLVDSVGDGEAATQSDILPLLNGAEVIFDYDEAGFLLGIEILQADKVFRPEMLARAPLPALGGEG